MPNFCHHCGRPGSTDGDFCRFCGERYGLAATTIPAQEEPSKGPGGVFQEVVPADPGYRNALRDMRRVAEYEGERNWTGLKVLGACALLIAVVWWAVMSRTPDNTGAASEQPSGFSEAIGDSAVAIPARNWKIFPVQVRSIPLLAPYLTGSFEAAGGSNDIRVLLLDQDGLTNLSNGLQYRFYYDSGRVTVAHPDVGPLAAGTYYLVFYNVYSLLTNKAVENHLQITYAPR